VLLSYLLLHVSEICNTFLSLNSDDQKYDAFFLHDWFVQTITEDCVRYSFGFVHTSEISFVILHGRSFFLNMCS